MDQDVIIEAVGKHLDTIEAYVNAIVVIAVACSWAGIRRSREVDALGIKFDRRHAFWALAVLLLLANMAILILFLRIGDLILLLDKAKLMQGITTLAVHSWVLNPFSYFGTSSIARFYSCEGYGLLIATWWLCNTSLPTLMDDKRSRPARALLGLFLAIGLMSMFAVQRVQEIVLEMLKLSEPALHVAVMDSVLERGFGTALGIVVGGLIFLAANRLQARLTMARGQ